MGFITAGLFQVVSLVCWVGGEEKGHFYCIASSVQSASRVMTGEMHQNWMECDLFFDIKSDPLLLKQVYKNIKPVAEKN